MLIVLSSVNSNGFSFLDRFEDLDASKIFIRDPYDAWYNRGVGDGLDSIEALTGYLRSEIARLRPNRVVMFGTSMGGYAALLLGLELGAESVVAVSPQSILDPRLPHTPSVLYPGPHFDLAPRFQACTQPLRITLFFGAADMVDCYNALRIQQPGVKLIPIKDADHLVAAQLTTLGVLHTAVKCAVERRGFSYKEDLDKGVLDAVITQLIIRTVESHYLDATYNAGRCARALATLKPGWSPPLFILAQIYSARKDYELAARYAQGAAEAAPRSVTCADLLATVLHRKGDDEKAMAAYSATLAIRPKHYNALCGLATLKAKHGKTSEALDLIDTALKTRPRLARASTLKAAILGGRFRPSEAPIELDKNQL